MFLILKGQRPKPICRECRKLHAGKRCPKLVKKPRYQISESTRDQREFMRMALAVQEDLRQRRAGNG